MRKRGATVEVVCANKACKRKFTARVADRKRGWGRHCSKSCKAVRQEARTGQYAAFQNRQARGEPTFSDAHLFSNEEHDCNKDWA